MASEFKYDDQRLRQLFASLSPKLRAKAFKKGFRRAANVIRNAAIRNLRSSIRSDRDLEKGVRVVLYDKTPKFRVTVGATKANKSGKGEAGFHTNRFGQKKPVLLWAEDGTKGRYTKKNSDPKARRKRAFRKRAAHFTGFMKRYYFLENAKNETVGRVTAEVHKFVTESIVRTSKKHGCK